MLREAMETVHSTEALIVDLRNNNGGSPDTVARVVSYLFGPERMRLISVHDRDGLARETFTSVELQGPRYGENEPAYVLTSDRTVSGGEEFAYDLKHFGRATIVGGTTRGGAHLAEPINLPHDFVMAVPHARNDAVTRPGPPTSLHTALRVSGRGRQRPRPPIDRSERTDDVSGNAASTTPRPP